MIRAESRVQITANREGNNHGDNQLKPPRFPTASRKVAQFTFVVHTIRVIRRGPQSEPGRLAF